MEALSIKLSQTLLLKLFRLPHTVLHLYLLLLCHWQRGDIYKESHDSRIKVISKAGTEKEEEEKDEEANGADKDDLGED